MQINSRINAKVFAAALFAAASLGAQAANVVLTAHGVKAATGGFLYATLYCGEAGWLDPSRAVANVKAPVTGEDVTLNFENVAPGGCAVNLFHDENGNGKLDFSGGMISIPMEGVAVSNNATRMGPPHYKKAEFKVTGAEVKQDVKMNY